ncbi:MAG TPA: hypothetical protein VGI92_11910 [Gemmatimonadales bacterium]|jgi:hypothetical protein
MRTLPALLLIAMTAGQARAQGSVASDLWRVAQSTLLVPAPLSDDGAAAFWTPVVFLDSASRLRLGLEAVHSPDEVGVTGGMAALTWRAFRHSSISVTYGRLGVAGVGYTETSPELLSSSLAIYNETASIGLAGPLASGLSGGVALRYLSGRLAFASHSQAGLDFGAQYTRIPHLRLGVSTRFFDPTFSRSGRDAATYSAGAEVRTSRFDAWGAPTTLALRYGLTRGTDNDTQQLISGGLSLGSALTLDAGASREETASDAVWRSLLGIGIAAGRYVVRIGRDGGVNAFGATYRFGLTALFK